MAPPLSAQCCAEFVVPLFQLSGLAFVQCCAEFCGSPLSAEWPCSCSVLRRAAKFAQKFCATLRSVRLFNESELSFHGTNSHPIKFKCGVYQCFCRFLSLNPVGGARCHSSTLTPTSAGARFGSMDDTMTAWRKVLSWCGVVCEWYGVTKGSR